MTHGLLDDDVNVREAIVRVLIDAGIDTVFGMPGGHTQPIFDALYDHRDEIRTVLVRHESLAGVMAQVYGRLTGRAGIAIGQGAFMLGAAVGALEAHFSGYPMVILTDISVEGRFAHHGAYQSGSGEYGSWDATRAFGGFTTRTMTGRGGAQSVQTVQMAIRHATSGHGGSIAVLLPIEAIRGRVGPSASPPVYAGTHDVLLSSSVPDDAALARAAALLAGAERPVLIVGNGAHRGNAYDAVAGFAKAAGIPVATTAGGKGAFAETDELSLGVFGNFGTPVANAAVAAADVVLVVGSKLSPSDTANENPALLDPMRQRLVQIDVEPLNIGWTFPVTLGLVGDASAVLADLTERLGAGDGRSAGANRVAALRQEHGWFDSPELLDDALPLLPQRVIRVLNETLPDDAIVCGDAGENRIFLTHHFRTTASGGFIQASGVGAMGYALPAAMAVKLVHPDRMAVAFCGDGGFALGMNGLLTAVEEKIPVVVVVMNNSALGWVLHGQRQRPIASRFGDFDLAAISRAMGCDARRVTTSDELREALDAARDVRVPTVIEVLVSLDQSYEDVTSPLMK